MFAKPLSAERHLTASQRDAPSTERLPGIEPMSGYWTRSGENCSGSQDSNARATTMAPGVMPAFSAMARASRLRAVNISTHFALTGVIGTRESDGFAVPDGFARPDRNGHVPGGQNRHRSIDREGHRSQQGGDDRKRRLSPGQRLVGLPVPARGRPQPETIAIAAVSNSPRRFSGVLPIVSSPSYALIYHASELCGDCHHHAISSWRMYGGMALFRDTCMNITDTVADRSREPGAENERPT